MSRFLKLKNYFDFVGFRIPRSKLLYQFKAIYFLVFPNNTKDQVHLSCSLVQLLFILFHPLYSLPFTYDHLPSLKYPLFQF